MKRQFLHEYHNKQDQARKAPYRDEIRLNAFTKIQQRDVEKLDARRLAILASVQKSVPFVGEFEQIFSGAQISFGERKEESSRRHTAWTFEAEVGLYGRYILEAKLPFLVDADRLMVVSHGKPELIVLKVSLVIMRSDGRAEARFDRAGQCWFGPKEWQSLVERHGDFSAIGYDMITNAPLLNFAAFCSSSGIINK